MLGVTYRYQVYNGTNVSVTVTVKHIQFKFASDGSITSSSESTPISATSATTGTYVVSSDVDNSSDKYIGSDITVTFAPGSSATGTVALYLQRSTDGGITYPSDGQGVFLGAVGFAASSASVKKNMIVR